MNVWLERCACAVFLYLLWYVIIKCNDIQTCLSIQIFYRAAVCTLTLRLMHVQWCLLHWALYLPPLWPSWPPPRQRWQRRWCFCTPLSQREPSAHQCAHSHSVQPCPAQKQHLYINTISAESLPSGGKHMLKSLHDEQMELASYWDDDRSESDTIREAPCDN